MKEHPINMTDRANYRFVSQLADELFIKPLVQSALELLVLDRLTSLKSFDKHSKSGLSLDWYKECPGNFICPTVYSVDLPCIQYLVSREYEQKWDGLYNANRRYYLEFHNAEPRIDDLMPVFSKAVLPEVKRFNRLAKQYSLEKIQYKNLYREDGDVPTKSVFDMPLIPKVWKRNAQENAKNVIKGVENLLWVKEFKETAIDKVYEDIADVWDRISRGGNPEGYGIFNALRSKQEIVKEYAKALALAEAYKTEYCK